MATDLATTCPACGASLPPDAPRGLCPRCLIRRGLGSDRAVDGSENGASGAGALLAQEPEATTGEAGTVRPGIDARGTSRCRRRPNGRRNSTRTPRSCTRWAGTRAGSSP